MHLYRNVWQILKTFNINLPLVCLLLGFLIPKRMKTYIHTKIIKMSVHRSFSYNRKHWKQPNIQQMDKQILRWAFSGILLSSEKGTNYWYKEQLG